VILFPRTGRLYWCVTDFQEVFVAVPARVKYRAGIFEFSNKMSALFAVDFEIAPPDETEDDSSNDLIIYIVSRRELYRTQKQAARVAAKLNERRDTP
jgi:hypothetical protein